MEQIPLSNIHKVDTSTKFEKALADITKRFEIQVITEIESRCLPASPCKSEYSVIPNKKISDIAKVISGIFESTIRHFDYDVFILDKVARRPGYTNILGLATEARRNTYKELNDEKHIQESKKLYHEEENMNSTKNNKVSRSIIAVGTENLDISTVKSLKEIIIGNEYYVAVISTDGKSSMIKITDHDKFNINTIVEDIIENTEYTADRLPGREIIITGLKNKDPLSLDTTGDALVNLIKNHIDSDAEVLFMELGMGEKVKNLPNDLTDLYNVTQALKLKLKGVAAVFVDDDDVEGVHTCIENGIGGLLNIIDIIQEFKCRYLNNDCDGGAFLDEFLDIVKYFKK